MEPRPPTPQHPAQSQRTQRVGGNTPDWAFVEQVVLAEAASQGLEGQKWVACTMRERGWNLRGYVGGRRPDLAAFVAKQPQRIREQAHRAVVAVREGFDCGGATHFENVLRFGEPPWRNEMVVVKRVGVQTFYRRKPK